MARSRGCMFSSVSFSGKPLKISLNCALKTSESIDDRDLEKFDVRDYGRGACIVDTSAGRVWAGHGNAGHVFRAERIGRDNAHDRGIDSAAQTDNSGTKIAFATVIVHTQAKARQKAPRGFALVKWDCTGRICIDDIFCPRESRPVARSNCPAGFTAMEFPSKMSWSFPPTALQ